MNFKLILLVIALIFTIYLYFKIKTPKHPPKNTRESPKSVVMESGDI